MQIYSESQKGSRSEFNEDAYLCSPKNGIFLVADGMGGHTGSAVASQTLVRSFLIFLQETTNLSVESIKQKISEINLQIHELGKLQAANRGIGCTLSVLWKRADKLTLFHVGDSRIYLLRDFKLSQLTTDHTTKKATDLGMFKQDGVSTRGITRAIGIKPKVKIDIYNYSSQPRDVFLLMSDGISDVVPDFQLLNILTSPEIKNADKLSNIVVLASEQKGTDDKTAILIFNESDE